MRTHDASHTQTTMTSTLPPEHGAPADVSTHLYHDLPSRRAQVGHFLRHLGEMTLAMMVGMGAAIAALAFVFSTVLASTVQGMTRTAVVNQYAVLICLVMIAGMTLSMVAWMRSRGMAWRPVTEMAAAMVVPAIPLIGLFEVHVLSATATICLSCCLMVPAMIVAMLLRLDLYTGRTGHHAYAT